LLLNPGSATGAWSFLADKTPSFMHLRLEGGDNSAKNALSSEDGILISLNLYCLIGHEQLSEKRLRYKKIEEKICRIGR